MAGAHIHGNETARAKRFASAPSHNRAESSGFSCFLINGYAEGRVEISGRSAYCTRRGHTRHEINCESGEIYMAKVRGIYEKRLGSGIWWIRYTVNGVKRREKAGSKGNAVKLLAKRQTEKLQSLKLPEVNRRVILFSELLDDAVEHSRAENGERSTAELKLKIARLRPEWGSRRADAIKKQDIVSWLQSEKTSRDWSTATTNRYQACFSLIFRVAMENEKISSNPASRIRRKGEDNQKTRYLTDDEEKRLRRILADRHSSYLPILLISLHTGLRASEQWRLQWADVDLCRRILTVRKQKHGKGERHIPLNDVAVASLKLLLPTVNADGPVFLNSEGTSMKSHRAWFDPAVKAAEITSYTWHANRHTFASRLAMTGVDIRTIAELMGHRTIQMSMRYAHLSPDHNQAAVDRLVVLTGQADTRPDTSRVEHL